MAIFGTLPTMWTTSPSTMWFGQWKRKMLLNWQEATSKFSPLRTIVRSHLCTSISVILCPVLAAHWHSCMRVEKSKVLWNGTDSVLNFTHIINNRHTYICKALVCVLIICVSIFTYCISQEAPFCSMSTHLNITIVTFTVGSRALLRPTLTSPSVGKL